jgi:hypothetical protein
MHHGLACIVTVMPVNCKRKLTAAYHVCASSGMLPAPDEIGLMSISR